MFVFGLVVGPLIGLLVGDFLVRRKRAAARWGVVALLLVCFAILVLGIGSLELRIGLVAGLLLGTLLAGTPLSPLAPEDA